VNVFIGTGANRACRVPASLEMAPYIGCGRALPQGCTCVRLKTNAAIQLVVGNAIERPTQSWPARPRMAAVRMYMDSNHLIMRRGVSCTTARWRTSRDRQPCRTRRDQQPCRFAMQSKQAKGRDASLDAYLFLARRLRSLRAHT
jgi:hypothetical protein